MKRKVFGIFPDLLVVQDVPVRPCFVLKWNLTSVQWNSLTPMMSNQCCLKPLFQSEAKTSTKMTLFSHANKLMHFHNKSFPLSLVLKARVFRNQNRNGLFE